MRPNAPKWFLSASTWPWTQQQQRELRSSWRPQKLPTLVILMLVSGIAQDMQEQASVDAQICQGRPPEAAAHLLPAQAQRHAHRIHQVALYHPHLLQNAINECGQVLSSHTRGAGGKSVNRCQARHTATDCCTVVACTYGMRLDVFMADSSRQVLMSPSPTSWCIALLHCSPQGFLGAFLAALQEPSS